ncbi:MAG: urease accessory UreF family protein, partial [Chthoniobacteraceae bacterium]
MNAELAWLPALLQTSDALFPTGAYAHSLGFEEFARLGGVRDEAGLREFAELHLLPALRQQELPYLRFAHDAADECALFEIDREISAWKLAPETREASISVGRRRLAALRTIHGAEKKMLAALTDAIARGNAHGHHLTVCAVQARVDGFPLGAALGAWFYQSLSGLCSASLKLIRIGQDGCQRVLRHTLAQAEATIAASLDVERDDAG